MKNFKGLVSPFAAFAIFTSVTGGANAESPSSEVKTPARFSLETAIKTALERSPEVQAAEARQSATRLQEMISLSPFLPTLSLETGYELHESDLENSRGAFVYGASRWSLYNGGRDRIARRLRSAEAERASSELELTRTDAARDAARHFIEAAFYSQAILIKKNALEANEKLARIARRKAQGGITSKADVLEFSFRENSIENELILLEHEKDLAIHNLQLVLGIPLEHSIEVAGGLQDAAKSLAEFRKNGTLKRMPREQLAVLAAEDDVRTSQLRFEESTATWLPSATLVAQYGDLRFADPEIQGRPAGMLALNVSIPIFSGLETLHARRLKSEELRESEARLRASQLKLRHELHHQEEKLDVISRLLKLQEENIARAEKFLDATVTEYNRGVRNAPDVTGASETFYQARLRKLELMRDKYLAELGWTESAAREH